MIRCKKLPDNFVVIDDETTGVPDENTGIIELAILEIGAVDTAGRMFYRRVAMERGRQVQQFALRCNGIDPLDLGVGVSIEDALCDFFDWLNLGHCGRWLVGGKNPQFDYGFNAANWPKGTVGSSIGEGLSRRCIDLHSLAYGYGMELGLDMAGDDFSTDDIYKQLGLEREPCPHNALRGAVHEMEGFRRLLVEGVEHDMDPVFEEQMETMDRDWVQSADVALLDNRRGARVEPLAVTEGAAV